MVIFITTTTVVMGLRMIDKGNQMGWIPLRLEQSSQSLMPHMAAAQRKNSCTTGRLKIVRCAKPGGCLSRRLFAKIAIRINGGPRRFGSSIQHGLSILGASALA